MPSQSKFEKATKRIPDLCIHFRSGLRALKKSDKEHIKKTKSAEITGSIDLDSSLKTQYPTKPLLDYVIGQKQKDKELLHWIEIHAATNEKDILKVLNKFDWLLTWLKDQGVPFKPISFQFIWISTAKVYWNARSNQGKRIAQKGIKIFGERYEII